MLSNKFNFINNFQPILFIVEQRKGYSPLIAQIIEYLSLNVFNI